MAQVRVHSHDDYLQREMLLNDGTAHVMVCSVPVSVEMGLIFAWILCTTLANELQFLSVVVVTTASLLLEEW